MRANATIPYGPVRGLCAAKKEISEALTIFFRGIIKPSGYLTRWYYSVSPDPLSLTFAALSDPTRRAILAQLSEGERSVQELAAPFDMSLPAVSKHLKVLERAGLIARGREAQWRPARLDPRALRKVDDWLERYRGLWEQRLDRLDDYLQELQGRKKNHGRKK